MDGSETVSDETNTHNHQSSPNDTENEYVPPVPDSERNGYKKTKRSDLTYTSTTPPIKVAKLTPRMTRSSHNPEFVAKQRKFLNRVHDPIRRDNSDVEYSSDANTPISTKQLKDPKNKLAEHKSTGGSEIKRKSDRYLTPKRHGETDEDGTGKKRRTKEPTKVVGGVDSYCWHCHRDGNVFPCEICPRVYHLRCVHMDTAPPKGWMCPECSTLMQAENTDTRSRAMRMLTLDQLCNMIRYALIRMKNHEGAEDFLKAVDVAKHPEYPEYIVKPMDLAQLEHNIKAKMYGSTEAFLADAKWMLHNSTIFNTAHSKFTNTARALVRICYQETQEIENCPDCYQNAHTRSTDSWFIEACRRPHVLLWAKLKGYPFWPAKAMACNSENQIDVRFFGAHDRAWVPINSCFLLSKLSPTPTTNKSKRGLEECLLEVESHIKKLRDKFGQFEYPPYKTPYDPNNEDAQLAMFLPKFEAKTPGKRTRLSLHHDGARKVFSPSKPVENSPGELPVSSPSSPFEAKTPGKRARLSLHHDGAQKALTPSKPVENSSGELPVSSPSSSIKVDDNEETPPTSGSPAVAKKICRTPLTAAAKKCFPNEDYACVKCAAKIDWTKDMSNKPLCGSCSKIPHPQKGKVCAKCNTKISSSGNVAQSGLVYCDLCFPLQAKSVQMLDVQYKKDGRASDPNATIRGTVTIQRKLSTSTCEAEAVGDDQNAGDVDPDGVMEGDIHTAVTSEEGRTVEGSSQQSISTKVNENENAAVLKKSTIVDRLQEKLCYAVEESVKSQISDDRTEEEVEPVNISLNVANNAGDKTGGKHSPTTSQPTVMLHDLKNDKDLMDKIKENDVSQITDISEPIQVEVHTLTDSGSDPKNDILLGTQLENVSVEINSTKKKQNNINNVVKSIQERKSSVDEKSDQNIKNLKERTSLMLDDTSDEAPILIIDEGDSNSSDTKKSPLKAHKIRRKGVPAKVFSRSSTECSDISVSEEQPRTLTNVLDEVSGQFRGTSSESNLTITVVTDNEHKKKCTKDVRTVNISKSLSLSIVNDSAATLEMECAAENDDQVIPDSVIKKMNPRPTARKTLPNPPPLLQEKVVHFNTVKLADVQPINSLSSLVDQVTPPPPLLNLRPGPPQPAQVYSEKPQKQPHSSATSICPPKNNLGPTNTQLDGAVQKMAGQLRTVVEDLLHDLSETGDAEATVKTMQLEMERLQWCHRQEIAEVKYNADKVLLEVRASLEADKQRALLDAKHKFEVEKEQAVLETKLKQWCAYCQKEAQLYCCWNTAYCSYNCQQSHWAPHMNSCLNKQQGSSIVEVPPPRVPDYIPAGQEHGHYAWADENQGQKKVPARRRCGLCQGCTTQPCGECYGCTTPKSHSVCKYRRCSRILTTKHSQRVKQQMMPPPSDPPLSFPRSSNSMRTNPSMYGGASFYHRGSM